MDHEKSLGSYGGGIAAPENIRGAAYGPGGEAAPGFSFPKERADTLDRGAVFFALAARAKSVVSGFASVKGIIFTEFLEMVEARDSPAFCSKIFKSGG